MCGLLKSRMFCALPLENLAKLFASLNLMMNFDRHRTKTHCIAVFEMRVCVHLQRSCFQYLEVTGALQF